jgi:hypothetical protein
MEQAAFPMKNPYRSFKRNSSVQLLAINSIQHPDVPGHHRNLQHQTICAECYLQGTKFVGGRHFFISQRRLAFDRRALFSRSSSIISRLQSHAAQESCVPRVASEVVKLLLPCNERQRASALLKIPFEPIERSILISETRIHTG